MIGIVCRVFLGGGVLGLSKSPVYGKQTAAKYGSELVSVNRYVLLGPKLGC